MVKLPVILYNRDSTEEVLIDAIQLQRNLERRALETERRIMGLYVPSFCYKRNLKVPRMR